MNLNRDGILRLGKSAAPGRLMDLRPWPCPIFFERLGASYQLSTG